MSPITSALKVTSAPLINRGGLTGQCLIDQMADDMRVFSASAASITTDDLELLGYSPAQIARHARDAARLAHQRAVR